ncbi:XPG domain containing-domain-containing protein [Biscogniauxia sp. FL1348]|nr:XPG domain containing-domain-containing protein [Biscogniauxia sp. FL1348]
MGIPGITQVLRGYGSFTCLRGESVVIDGPSLVYRIYEGIVKYRPFGAGFVCMPPYAFLARATITWLYELQKHGVNVRSIYFDGYLPPSKWAVRRSRLIGQSENMKSLLLSHPSGSPPHPSNAFDHVNIDVSITNKFAHRMLNAVPKPPFLIPAVLELLARDSVLGPLVRVVPGEADVFCAEDVRQNDGGTVVTGDSDLLITDLGPHGRVAFFGDIEPPRCWSEGESPSIKAWLLSSSDINRKMGIADAGGISYAAFVKINGEMSFAEAIEHIKTNSAHELDSPEYHHFMEEHQMREYISPDHPVLGILSTLDPRISEVVVQSLLLQDQSTGPRGPENLSIFLPVLIEHHDRKSAWDMSTPVRQIAYSLLRSADIIEYRVLDRLTSVPGRRVEIPEPEEAVGQLAQLVETLKKLNECPVPSNMEWFVFAAYQDIVWSASEGRPSQLAALLYKVEDEVGDTEEYSWDLIHFTASFHASLYSLRILKQLLKVSDFLERDLPGLARELDVLLSTLPGITEWPTIEDMPALFSTFREAGAATFITNMLGMPEIPSPKTPLKPGKSKKKKNNKRSKQVRRIRPASLNPFAVLSEL